MVQPDQEDISSAQLEENLKKALTELLLLHLLSKRPSYIGELAEHIHQKSDGVLNIVFPYGAIYRLQNAGYICETEKRTAPDGRRRQYFSITDRGRLYLEKLLITYKRFNQGITDLLERGDTEYGG